MSETARDQIRLLGISATGHHGVYAEERRNGQPFSVDLTLWLDTRRAALTDDLHETVDYSVVAADVAALIGGEPVWLIESLAEKVAATALQHAPVEAVDVVVHKPQAPLSVSFTDVEVAIHRTRADLPMKDLGTGGGLGDLGVLSPAAALVRRPEAERQVVLALGANLGDPVNTLRQVVDELRQRPELREVEVSPLARTAPVLAPGQPPQPDYYNAVVVARSRHSALEILQIARELENRHGRVRDERWGARTLDVDIIDIEGLLSSSPELTLPHPRAAQRAFVLLPWVHLQPHATLAGQPLSALLEQVGDEGVLRLWHTWLEAGTVTAPAGLELPAETTEVAEAAAEAEEGAAPRPAEVETAQAAEAEAAPEVPVEKPVEVPVVEPAAQVTDVAAAGEGEPRRVPSRRSIRSAGLALPSWQDVIKDEPRRIVDEQNLDILRSDATPTWRPLPERPEGA